jgi:hypothetical protein
VPCRAHRVSSPAFGRGCGHPSAVHLRRRESLSAAGLVGRAGRHGRGRPGGRRPGRAQGQLRALGSRGHRAGPRRAGRGRGAGRPAAAQQRRHGPYTGPSPPSGRPTITGSPYTPFSAEPTSPATPAQRQRSRQSRLPPPPWPAGRHVWPLSGSYRLTVRSWCIVPASSTGQLALVVVREVRPSVELAKVSMSCWISDRDDPWLSLVTPGSTDPRRTRPSYGCGRLRPFGPPQPGAGSAGPGTSRPSMPRVTLPAARFCSRMTASKAIHQFGVHQWKKLSPM